MAREPNHDGHFGRATADTHGLYETLPAPAIALERVIRDVQASGRGGEDDVWMIDEIIPVIVNPPAVRAPEDPNRAARERQRQRQEAGEPDVDREGGNAPILDPEPEAEDCKPVGLETIKTFESEPIW